MLAKQKDGTGIAEHPHASIFLHLVEIAIHDFRTHFERGHEPRSQQPVTYFPRTVLPGQLQRRAPEYAFAVADADAPPAFRPPARRHVAAHPRRPQIKSHRRSRRSAGRKWPNSPPLRTLQIFQPAAKRFLSQERELGEIGNRLKLPRGKTRLLHDFAIVSYVAECMGQQAFQPALLDFAQLFRPDPLFSLHLADHAERGMPFRAFVEAKENIPGERSVGLVVQVHLDSSPDLLKSSIRIVSSNPGAAPCRIAHYIGCRLRRLDSKIKNSSRSSRSLPLVETIPIHKFTDAVLERRPWRVAQYPPGLGCVGEGDGHITGLKREAPDSCLLANRVFQSLN